MTPEEKEKLKVFAAFYDIDLQNAGRVAMSHTFRINPQLTEKDIPTPISQRTYETVGFTFTEEHIAKLSQYQKQKHLKNFNTAMRVLIFKGIELDALYQSNT
ncbi:MAG: hypothetical protein MRY49_03295 [Candidatus Pacebacteria bacterium]|nr:hypothetical protein [Candidatus Paceibacterota bacterium]